MTSQQDRGQWGEGIAAQALEAHRYEIIERNWHCRYGEVDLVARDGDTWVFVEVKVRAAASIQSPEEAVSQTKRTRLWKTALAYLTEHDLDDVNWRIDVVAIRQSRRGKVFSLEIYQDAVRADG
jgi:putative endonuclease